MLNYDITTFQEDSHSDIFESPSNNSTGCDESFCFFFTDEHVIKITVTGRGCDKGNGKRSIQLLFSYLNYKGNCLFLKEMAKN